MLILKITIMLGFRKSSHIMALYNFNEQIKGTTRQRIIIVYKSLIIACVNSIKAARQLSFNRLYELNEVSVYSNTSPSATNYSNNDYKV